jgi:hypothetical protein
MNDSTTVPSPCIAGSDPAGAAYAMLMERLFPLAYAKLDASASSGAACASAVSFLSYSSVMPAGAAASVAYPFASNAPNPMPYVLPLEFFVVNSNVLFIPVVLQLLYLRYYLSAAAIFATMLVSYTYHVCRSYGACLLPLERLIIWDHLFATSVIQVVFICFGSFLSVVNHRANAFFLMGSFLMNGFFISLRTEMDESSTVQDLCNLLYGIFIIWCSYRMEDRSPMRKFVAKIHWRRAVIGFLIGFCGLASYLVHIEGEQNGVIADLYNRQKYIISHTIWHVMVSIGLYYVVSSGQFVRLQKIAVRKHKEQIVAAVTAAQEAVAAGQQVQGQHVALRINTRVIDEDNDEYYFAKEMGTAAEIEDDWTRNGLVA